MKKAASTVLSMLMLLLSIPCASAEGALDSMPQFAWAGQTMAVSAIYVNPDHVVNDTPDTDQYLMLRLVCTTGEVSIGDIMDNLDSLYLVDMDGNTYYQAAYMPYCMTYSRRNRVFATAAMQPQFDLFFIVPAGTAVDTLNLEVDMGDIVAFADYDLDTLVK